MRPTLVCAMLTALPGVALAKGIAQSEVRLHILPIQAIGPAIDASKGKPLAIGAGVPTALTESDGTWDSPEAGVSRWRLRISSEGAYHLSPRLGALELPQGSELWLYSSDGSDRQGPFDATGALSQLLPVVRASEAVLEATVPDAERGNFHIEVAEVVHGYRELGHSGSFKGQLGNAAGSCNIDVACTDGNNWRNDIRSAIIYTRAEQQPLGTVLYKCSGLLVNNARQDDRALVLTANHCGVTALTRMSDVKVYFNVQKPSCGSTQSGPINQVIPGGKFLARDQSSDFTLFELASVPPSTYGAYYAGWDVRGNATPGSGITLHHPGGDDKKISTYTEAPKRVNGALITGGVVPTSIDAWQVRWSPGHGVTEPGSSGSGLWNQDHRVVGVLSGGSSSCDDARAPDLYGRLDRAWGAGLKAQLDPDNSGVLVFNGKDAGGARASVPDQTSPAGDSGGGGGGGGAFDWLTLVALAGAAWRRRARA